MCWITSFTFKSVTQLGREHEVQLESKETFILGHFNDIKIEACHVCFIYIYGWNHQHPPWRVPKQTWNQSISAKKSPSHLLDLGKIKPLYVGQFKQPLVLAKLKSRLKWASRNSIIRCPIWPLVLAQHWANTGLESPISPVYVGQSWGQYTGTCDVTQ